MCLMIEMMHRHQFNCKKPLFYNLLIWALGFVCLSSKAFGVSVYLDPKNHFASGEYARSFLEKKTHNYQAIHMLQFRAPSGKVGWAPANQFMFKRALATRAIVLKNGMLRANPDLSSTLIGEINLGDSVTIKSWGKRWSLIECASISGWVDTADLKPDFQTPKAAWVIQRSRLTSEAREKSLHTKEIVRGERVVLTESQDKQREWASVSYQDPEGEHHLGYLRAKNLLTAASLKEDELLPIWSRFEMLSSPRPGAKTIAVLNNARDLKLVSDQYIIWGQVTIDDISYWWNSGEEGELSELASIRVSSSELMQRRLFDIVSSPVLPRLQIASAQGVFKTQDGKHWRQIDLFGDRSEPLAVAQDGTLFAGAYLSRDHGESFEPYVRFENLVTILKYRFQIAPTHLTLLEIKPLDHSGLKLRVRVSAGGGKTADVYTADQGKTWSNHPLTPASEARSAL